MIHGCGIVQSIKRRNLDIKMIANEVEIHFISSSFRFDFKNTVIKVLEERLKCVTK